jgi:hypothetical protein
VTETTHVRMTTRRKLLTRDLKAICAMAAVPAAAQMIFPDAASAHEHAGGGSDFWGFGSSRDRGDRRRDWDWGRSGHDEQRSEARSGWGFENDRGDDRHRDWGWESHGHHEHEGDGWGGGQGGHGRTGGTGSRGGNCFLKGTRILTATGERNIEDLVAGDLLPTTFGGTRPVQSIGKFRRIRSEEGPWPKHARPVRIARSALAPDVPHRDLYVTQGHALLFDDILIPAGHLINGTTISLYGADEHNELEFFHLTLETHDVIYAEGAPCETLLDIDNSMSNFTPPTRQHAATRARELHCAPIICNGSRSELKIRLRSLMSPWLGPQKFDDIRTDLELRALSLGAA